MTGVRVNATITREDNGPLADVKAVGDGLDAFNHSRAGEYGYAAVRFFVRDDNGAIAGGLLADVYFRWMFVKMLWLDERLRGHGTGAELMRRAEAAARAQGCTG